MKTCSKCCKTKSTTLFTINKASLDGFHSWCKDCRSLYYKENKEKWRKSDIERRYSITFEDYIELGTQQNNCCFICGKTEKENKRKLALDHCHSTNKVRNLLCDTCNRVLGLVKENKQTLQSMISYLEKHEK